MRPGDVVADRFVIERVAGAGGMGTVYRALDRETGLPVALKVLLGQDGALRFAREARLLSSTRHPAIVRHVASGAAEDGSPYLVMEWVEGEELVARLGRGRLGVGDSVRLARRVADALAAVHALGVVHRDLKPSNLLLGGGRVEEIKLLDFGIALPADASRELTRAGTTIGTPGYMAPEQARGERDVDARADLFSLGCVLFQCLTGQPAFTGSHVIALLAKVLLEDAPRVTSLRPEVPAALADLVDRLLCKRPEGRPESAARVVSELDALGPPGELDRLEGIPLGAGSVEVPSSSTQLTAGEQRLLSVILIGAPEATVVQAQVAAPEEARGPARAADVGVGAEETALAPSVRLGGAGLFDVALGHGARLDRLADGSSVLTLGGSGEATDRATASARCALAARSAAAGLPIVLAMGRGRAGELAPVGEVIERAARLLRRGAGAGADRGIAVDELTAGLLGDRFEVRAEGGGLSLRAEREALGADQRLFLGRATPCVGRDRELRSLTDELEVCLSEPSARAVLVTGEAGVGKSRLRHELVRRVRAGDGAPQIWIARGDPLSAGSPFDLLGQALRRVAGVTGGEPIEDRRRKLRERIGRHLGAEGRRAAEFLGELCGTPFPDEGNVQLRAARHDPVVMGDQMSRAWVDFLDAECQSQPVLLVLEDLHWGDLPTVQHVDAALRLLPERPFMVLAIARPDVDKLFPNLWAKRSLVTIQLGALGRRACAELARAVLDERATPATLERLWAQSAGNVLFLEELLRATVEGRGGEAPLTVLAMVQARLEGIDPEARRVLRAASVFGQRFWRGGVATLTGGAPIDGALAKLADDEMISRARETKLAGEIEYVFRHSLVREAAYGMLTEEDRAVGHRLAGAWLEGAGEGAAGALAEHFEKGGEPGRAAVWYRRAAEHAFEGDDLSLAVTWADRAITCAESDPAQGDVWVGEVYRLRASMVLWRGQNHEARRCGLLAMRRLRPGSDAWAEATTEVAVASARVHDLEQVHACCDALLAISEPRDPEGADGRQARDPEGADGHDARDPEGADGRQARDPEGADGHDARDPEGADGRSPDEDASPSFAISLARTARIALFVGAPAKGDLLLRRSEAIARRIPSDPVLSAQVELAHSIRALITGDLSANLRLAESARAGFDLAGDRRNACQQVSNVGYAYLQLGVHEAAERALRSAITDAERLGIAALVVTAKLNLGVAIARAGRVAEGISLVEEALVLSFDHADRRVEAFGRIYLARLCLLAGDAARALRECQSVVGEPATLASLRAFAWGVLSAAHLARGEVPSAADAAREAMSILATVGDVEEGEALIRLTAAEAWSAAGEVEAARAGISEAREKLLAHAAKIADVELRRSFLEGVPENARTLELAAALSGELAAGPDVDKDTG